ncbi:MAG TPA: hypothetical protein VK484_06440 [Ferruginibacter sp.]|nr:hypothetical protein [Ferruginibacter sp.]
MRTAALILLFPFTVYMTETASFIPAMAAQCALVATEESSCCMKTNDQDECSMPEDTEEAPGDCTDSPDCTTCPVCYSFIFQPRYEWSPVPVLIKKDYSLLDTSYSSSYTSNVWKPPNGFSYSL